MLGWNTPILTHLSSPPPLERWLCHHSSQAGAWPTELVAVPVLASAGVWALSLRPAPGTAGKNNVVQGWQVDSVGLYIHIIFIHMFIFFLTYIYIYTYKYIYTHIICIFRDWVRFKETTQEQPCHDFFEAAHILLFFGSSLRTFVDSSWIHLGGFSGLKIATANLVW